jgi:hypothetical protein
MKITRKTGIILGLLLISVLIFLNSCMEDYWDFNKIDDEIEVNTWLAGPIVYGSVSIQDLLNEIDNSSDYIHQFDDDLLYLAFSNNLLSYTAEDVVNIPDQQFIQLYLQSDIDIPAWVVSSLGDTISFQKRKNGEFTFSNGEIIDSIHIKKTMVNMHIESSFKHEGILIVKSDSLIGPDGKTFEKQIMVGNTSGTFTTNIAFPIDGSKILFDNETDPSRSFLPLDIELKLINSLNPILSSESCDITVNFDDITFSSIYGYLGEYEMLQNSGEVAIDLFEEDIEGGTVLFADPRLALNIRNSYGLPVEIEFSDLTTYSKINDVTTPVTFTGVNPFYIESPTINQVGEVVDATYYINKDNSNVDQALATLPSKFNYTIRAATNPLGPTDNDNFVTDSSKMEADIEVILPLYVRAGGFSIHDTSAFDLDAELGEEIDFMEYFRLTLEATNGMPASVNMQIIFTDENYNPVDSVFLDNDLILEAAELDANDKVVSPLSKTKSVVFDKDRIQNAKPTKFMIVTAKINTTNYESDPNQYVKFYSYYTLDFSVRARAGARINSRELN